jgi:hypothetical protein
MTCGEFAGKLMKILMGFDRLRDRPEIIISIQNANSKKYRKIMQNESHENLQFPHSQKQQKKSLFHFPQNFENVPTKQLYFLK